MTVHQEHGDFQMQRGDKIVETSSVHELIGAMTGDSDVTRVQVGILTLTRRTPSYSVNSLFGKVLGRLAENKISSNSVDKPGWPGKERTSKDKRKRKSSL